MAVINAQNISRAYGPEDIFEGVSVSIPHGARIGLVGPNGAGKTSLLRILIGLEAPDTGTVTMAKSTRLGFLPQRTEEGFGAGRTLWEQMLSVFSDLLAQETRLHDLADAIAAYPDDAGLLEQYGSAQARFEREGGYTYANRIEQVLTGLGFEPGDYQRPVTQLSGGQRTRALLAHLLLEAPDLLLLDEPTNHLDIQAIEWLENWLRDYPGALLIVSHDRYFLDRVVTHIWELIFGQLEEYRGNFSHYAQQREERHTALLRAYERQQEFIAKEEDYIRRNIAGQNTRQAQGRRKRLERFLKDEAILAPRHHARMHLALGSVERSGDEVIRTRDLVIGYHDDRVPLFTVPDITLYRGERAALIGPNGAGKTTFMKTLLGQLAPLGGTAKLGSAVEIGYFAQAHEGLHDTKTVLDEIMEGTQLLPAEARDYLGKYLFSGDDVYKPISTLSGGERGRVALARLALSGANLLLLDEPTNHLDIASQEVLETVLAEFTGTIILITHDRYLVRNLATQIWDLHPARGEKNGKNEMIVFAGPYEEYLSSRDGRTAPPPPPAKKPQPARATTAPSGTLRVPMSKFERGKRLAQVEEQIARLEVEIVNLSGALEEASAAGQVERVTELGAAYTRTEADLEALMLQWEELLVSD
ncbi:MAG: ABC-F family ATP-binding cassette domain-containing protein [Anaerolineae bacterium]|nr:ABC-F family ATP-binding cassette domain-containing protein [Anaerolineae bacterium]